MDYGDGTFFEKSEHTRDCHHKADKEYKCGATGIGSGPLTAKGTSDSYKVRHGACSISGKGSIPRPESDTALAKK